MVQNKATIQVDLKDWKKVHERVDEMRERYEQAMQNQIAVINRLMGRMQAAERDAEGAKRAIALIMQNQGLVAVDITVAEMVRINNEAHIETEFDADQVLHIRLKDGPQPEGTDKEEESKDV